VPSPQATLGLLSGNSKALPEGWRAVSHHDDHDHNGGRLRRREALAAAGTLGLGGLLGSSRLRAGVGLDEQATAAAASCVLTPEVTEGPYWIENHLTRRDIRAGRPGLLLEVVLSVQNANTCRAIRHADVEIWHCDATASTRATRAPRRAARPPARARTPAATSSPPTTRATCAATSEAMPGDVCAS
jgi:hypothetical protein